jgi:hypothetical protein
MRTKGVAALVVIGAASVAGCAPDGHAPQEAAAVASVDSVFMMTTSPLGDSLSFRLSWEEKFSLFDIMAEPDRPLTDFLARLSVGTESEPLSPEEQADSVFYYFPHTDKRSARHINSHNDAHSDLDDARAAYAWGAIAKGTVGPTAAALFVPCKAVANCGQVVQANESALHDPQISAVDRPDVELFFRSELRVDGYNEPIHEVKHEDAAKMVARAVCIKGVPTIQYSPRLNPNFSPVQFAFVRAHEHAHWRSGHLRCGAVGPALGKGIPDVRTREFAADCAAALALKEHIRYGGSIPVVAAERFGELAWEPWDGYPGTRERKDYLYNRCR